MDVLLHGVPPLTPALESARSALQQAGFGVVLATRPLAHVAHLAHLAHLAHESPSGVVHVVTESAETNIVSTMEVCHGLRAHGATGIFVLTEHHTATRIEALLAAGVDDFVILPTPPDLLALQIRRLARRIGDEAEKQSERALIQELRKSEARYRAALDGSLDAFLVLASERDASNKIVDFVFVDLNARAAQMFGAKREQIVGRRLCELRPSNRTGGFFDKYVHVVETGEPLEEEFPVHEPGREVCFRRHQVVSVGDGIAITSRDITELYHMQQQLRVSERMASVGTLAAGVAHEINNPLGYMILNLGFVSAAIDRAIRASMAGSAVDTARLREIAGALETIREGADRVREIVRNLMTFARAPDEKTKPVDVVEVLESCLQVTDNQLRHRARVVRDLGPMPLAQANEGRLGQVFLNLLVNAAHAIPEGAAASNEIHVSTRQSADGHAIVEIRDSGAGIQPEMLPRIFDPFFTTKPLGEGMGLGLSICHGIISRLGGEIEVESEPGQGSVFRVILPAAESPLPEQRPLGAPVLPRRGRFLVLDDEPMLGEAVERMLRPDHIVEVETHARTALRRIAESRRYDAILCDLMMPEMTGMEFHEEVEKLCPAQAGRIVFITGGAFTAQSTEFLQRTGNPRLLKPFDRRELLATIAPLLDRDPEYNTEPLARAAARQTTNELGAARESSSFAGSGPSRLLENGTRTRVLYAGGNEHEGERAHRCCLGVGPCSDRRACGRGEEGAGFSS